MATADPQRIARLTPLADVLARIDAQVKPVAARACSLAAALGRSLAADAAALAQPAAPTALRDGYAVRAEDTTDAGSYAAAVLPALPARLDAGDRLPEGTDAVAPLDAIVIRGDRAEAAAPVSPGQGVLAQGADAAAGVALRRAGERLRSIDIAVLAAAGIAAVQVREPRIRLVTARVRADAVLDAVRGLIGRAIGNDGGRLHDCAGAPRDLAAAFDDAEADAIVAIGGTGSGSSDASVTTVARCGRLEVHGIALAPGETAAFGWSGTRPVLLVPGRIDAALAVWLTLGRAMIARLCGGAEECPGSRAVLARKIASPLGLAEVVPVRCRDGEAQSLASGYWPMQALARADGWILVPADSEGYPAGTEVVVRPWP